MSDRQTFAIGDKINRHHLEAVDAMTYAIESLRAENARLTKERNAFRTMAINHLWNHNLANAYGREEYQRQLDQQVDETLEDMLAKVKREPYEFSGWVEVVEQGDGR